VLEPLYYFLWHHFRRPFILSFDAIEDQNWSFCFYTEQMKVKVKFAAEEAMKAQRKISGISLLFL